MSENCKYWQCPYSDGISLFKAKFTSFEYSKHWHDELAIGLIQLGAEGIHMAGSTLVVPQGNIVAINPGEIHTGFGAHCNTWMYRMFYFDANFVCRIADELDICYREFPYIDRSILENRKLFALLLKLHLTSEQGCISLSYDSLIIEVFNLLFQYSGVHCPSSLRISRNAKAAIKIKDYIDQYWFNNIQLQDLSILSGLNQYQVICYFEKEYHISPHQYLIQKKLAEAKKLIHQGYKLSDVSADCGFYDQSHMIRNFKKSFAVTPSQIRAVQ